MDIKKSILRQYILPGNKKTVLTLLVLLSLLMITQCSRYYAGTIIRIFNPDDYTEGSSILVLDLQVKQWPVPAITVPERVELISYNAKNSNTIKMAHNMQRLYIRGISPGIYYIRSVFWKAGQHMTMNSITRESSEQFPIEVKQGFNAAGSYRVNVRIPGGFIEKTGTIDIEEERKTLAAIIGTNNRWVEMK
jgi:hypothetical protein